MYANRVLPIPSSTFVRQSAKIETTYFGGEFMSKSKWADAEPVQGKWGLWFKFTRDQNGNRHLLVSEKKEGVEPGGGSHEHYWEKDGKFYLQLRDKTGTAQLIKDKKGHLLEANTEFSIPHKHIEDLFSLFEPSGTETTNHEMKRDSMSKPKFSMSSEMRDKGRSRSGSTGHQSSSGLSSFSSRVGSGQNTAAIADSNNIRNAAEDLKNYQRYLQSLCGYIDDLLNQAHGSWQDDNYYTLHREWRTARGKIEAFQSNLNNDIKHLENKAVEIDKAHNA